MWGQHVALLCGDSHVPWQELTRKRLSQHTLERQQEGMASPGRSIPFPCQGLRSAPGQEQDQVAAHAGRCGTHPGPFHRSGLCHGEQGEGNSGAAQGPQGPCLMAPRGDAGVIFAGTKRQCQHIRIGTKGQAQHIWIGSKRQCQHSLMGTEGCCHHALDLQG